MCVCGCVWYKEHVALESKVVQELKHPQFVTSQVPDERWKPQFKAEVVILCYLLMAWLKRLDLGTPDTPTKSFHGFTHSLRANAGIVFRLVHNNFLPNLFQFIIRKSWWDAIYSLRYRSHCYIEQNMTTNLGNEYIVLWEGEFELYQKLTNQVPG
jgi:hypothetical protein